MYIIYIYIYNVWGHDSIQFYDTIQFDYSINSKGRLVVTIPAGVTGTYN